MKDIVARDWSLTLSDLEFLSWQPPVVGLECALQICAVRATVTGIA